MACPGCQAGLAGPIDMSYILEALKKADHTRTVGEIPGLESAHWGERRSRRARKYRWLWVVIALLVVNGILLAVLLDREAVEEQGVAVDGAGDTDTHPDALAVKPVPRPERKSPGERQVAPRPKVARPLQAPLARPVTPAMTRSAPVPGVPATPSVAVPPAPQPVQAAPSGVPGWDDLSLEFRSGFALPRIDVHVYADNPARRFILVDLEKYREGDTLASGAVVEKISPEGVQLYYQGKKFLVER
jgi:general secretion pathway protein B